MKRATLSMPLEWGVCHAGLVTRAAWARRIVVRLYTLLSQNIRYRFVDPLAVRHPSGEHDVGHVKASNLIKFSCGSM